MEKNFFPNLYKSKEKMNELLKFIDDFKSSLLIELKKYWHAVIVNTPLVELNNGLQVRKINFDNKNNGLVYEITSNPEYYLNQIFLDIFIDNNLNLLSQYTIFNRDIKLDNTKLITNEIIDLRISVNIDETQIKNWIEKNLNLFWNKLKEIFINIVQKYELEYNFAILNNEIYFFSIKDEKKLFQTLKDHQLLNYIIVDKKLVLINKYGIQDNDLFQMNYELGNKKYKYELFYWHKIIDKKISLMNVSFIEKNRDKYINIALEINNIILAFLNKAHLAEILIGIWPKELIDESKQKGINILYDKIHSNNS